jgi:molecular chaperone HtpG
LRSQIKGTSLFGRIADEKSGTTMTAEVETRLFEAETRELLNLMVHSLYTTKDIALRELISNASDALDRLRFESLTQPNLLGDDSELEICLVPDPRARTLTISDTGIGMSRKDVISDLGTIARSGTREFRKWLLSGEKMEDANRLIGQFGVGFYSAFMIADHVSVVTRAAGERDATKWESTGDGQYSITTCDKAKRGTEIALRLRPVDRDAGLEDYTSQWTLSRIVKKYSDFISYPIRYRGLKEKYLTENVGMQVEGREDDPVIIDTVLNSMKPLWERSPGDVSDSEYREFYRHITYSSEKPIKVLPLRAEGVNEYRALLYIPETAPADLYYHAPEFGLRLFANRVAINEKFQDLLPRYLRFVRGVVDSGEMPLNISRQRLQQDRQMIQLKKWLTKKVLEALQEIQSKDQALYERFWKEFGRALKEGVSEDSDNRERLLPLLLFQSSASADNWTTLQQYIERMGSDQSDIFYITGMSRSAVEASPYMEAVRDKNVEVLYMVDPVDELILQCVFDFGGHHLKSIAKGLIELGNPEERSQDAERIKIRSQEYKPMMDKFRTLLDAGVKEVRLSSRLRESPACLVVEDHDYSPRLERLLQAGGKTGLKQKRVLELNPDHPITRFALEHFRRDPENAVLGYSAQLLYGLVQIAEGSELTEPVQFTKAAVEILQKALSGLEEESGKTNAS